MFNILLTVSENFLSLPFYFLFIRSYFFYILFAIDSISMLNGKLKKKNKKKNFLTATKIYTIYEQCVSFCWKCSRFFFSLFCYLPYALLVSHAYNVDGFEYYCCWCCCYCCCCFVSKIYLCICGFLFPLCYPEHEFTRFKHTDTQSLIHTMGDLYNLYGRCKSNHPITHIQLRYIQNHIESINIYTVAIVTPCTNARRRQKMTALSTVACAIHTLYTKTYTQCNT